MLTYSFWFGIVTLDYNVPQTMPHCIHSHCVFGSQCLELLFQVSFIMFNAHGLHRLSGDGCLLGASVWSIWEECVKLMALVPHDPRCVADCLLAAVIKHAAKTAFRPGSTMAGSSAMQLQPAYSQPGSRGLSAVVLKSIIPTGHLQTSHVHVCTTPASTALFNSEYVLIAPLPSAHQIAATVRLTVLEQCLHMSGHRYVVTYMCE